MAMINELIIHVIAKIQIELAWIPIFVSLLVNLSRGTREKGSSNDRIIDVIIISFPAPAEPPISVTIRLGMIAKVRVKRFRIHGVILRLRKPYMTYCPA